MRTPPRVNVERRRRRNGFTRFRDGLIIIRRDRRFRHSDLQIIFRSARVSAVRVSFWRLGATERNAKQRRFKPFAREPLRVTSELNNTVIIVVVVVV